MLYLSFNIKELIEKAKIWNGNPEYWTKTQNFERYKKGKQEQENTLKDGITMPAFIKNYQENI